ncbi:MAG: hypothetical protein PSX71_13970 [bacterium]|nr:hypothetical protein [bacterium]
MRKPYRLIIWGPGQLGGAITRAVLKRDEFEIVGARVFNHQKDGKDLGELVGMHPIGIQATSSRDAILAMEADCVIYTPMPAAPSQDLDEDIISLLQSGKNVISTAAHHNPSLPNHPATPPLLASRMRDACHKGGSSLHGTGLHPGFMVERLVMTLTRALTSVDHIRFVQAIDFSLAPEGMWGGLASMGFGGAVADLSLATPVLSARDLSCGAAIGNAAHALHGASFADMRVESRLRGLPATKNFRVGKTSIRKGSVAALHLTQRGYLDDRHFFTNEECWYLGPDQAYRGDNLPYGGFSAPLSYSIEIVGEPTKLQTQLEFEQSESINPFISITVQAVLDAIGPVCESAPGVVINDARPRYQSDDRLPQINSRFLSGAAYPYAGNVKAARS